MLQEHLESTDPLHSSPRPRTRHVTSPPTPYHIEVSNREPNPRQANLTRSTSVRKTKHQIPRQGVSSPGRCAREPSPGSPSSPCRSRTPPRRGEVCRGTSSSPSSTQWFGQETGVGEQHSETGSERAARIQNAPFSTRRTRIFAVGLPKMTSSTGRRHARVLVQIIRPGIACRHTAVTPPAINGTQVERWQPRHRVSQPGASFHHMGAPRRLDPNTIATMVD